VTIRTKLINRRYRLERRLTLSDTTETWLGFDNVLHRAVSVHVPRQEMLRDAPFLVEFLQRSRIATALHHRGIVAAFDSGQDGDLPYLVTEYAGGDRLTEIIRTEAPFDADDVAILVEQVAGALDYAHQRDFVHGNLTAADIVVDGQGATKLLGLGIPSGSVSLRSETGHRDPLTFDDDVQALAAIAFEMLTGEEPDPADFGLSHAAYLLDPDIPRNASDIIAIGLGAGSARFSSAGAFARSLRDWREFDPGDHFVPPEPVPKLDEIHAEYEYQSPRPMQTTEPESWISDEAEPAPATNSAASPTIRGVRLALIAALSLALLAGAIVWRGSDTTSDPAAEAPPQIQTLAELSGF
jgi:serine/threonine-protein kinase